MVGLATMSTHKNDVCWLRPGWGWGRAPRGELDWELKWANKENSQQPPARPRLAAASGDSDARKVVHLRLPAKRTQWIIGGDWASPGQSFAEKQCIRFRAVWESSAQYGIRERSKYFEPGYRSPISGVAWPFCLLATPTPSPVPAFFSFLLKVASLWLLLLCPSLQSRPSLA